jgi:acyl-CoA thioesterase FadM/ketosteroid isomerase-like protein
MADSSPRNLPPPELSLDEALAMPLTLQAAVEPRFIDQMGHMNVSFYVHLFDRATWAFFASLGIDGDYLRRSGAGMFAVEEHVRYLGELREGDPLEVHTRMIGASRKWVRLLHAMTDPVRRRVSAVAEVVGVHIDLATRRSAPFPDDLAPRIAAAVTPPPAAASAPAPAAMTEDRARALAGEWVAAWNAHDLERILEHYADDVVLTSPLAAQRLGDPGGTVRGKAALRAYFKMGLAAFPALRFDLVDVTWGVTSVVLYYVNQRGTMTCEFMDVDAAGKVTRVIAHYGDRQVRPPPAPTA